MNNFQKKSLILHPFLLSIFPIIFLLSNNIQLLSLQDVVFPIFLILGFVFILWIFLGKLIKNKIKSGLIISLGLVLFFSYGHVYNLVVGIPIGDLHVGNKILLFPFIISFILGISFFLKTKRNLTNATTIVNGISIVLIVISLGNIVTYGLNDNFFFGETDEKLSNNISIINSDVIAPNIYYIILDEYVGSKILDEFFDYDNHELIAELSKKGFFIASDSHSNYPLTFQSLASSLNMEYINYVSNELGVNSKDRHVLFQMIKNNKVMANLKSYGYTIYNFDSGWGPTASLDIADSNLCRKNLFDSELIMTLIRTSILNPVYVKLFENNHREKILCIFSELPEIQQKSDTPFFVFAHIFLPHSPYVFGPNGESITPETLALNSDWKDTEGYLNQVKFADKKIIEVVDKILSQSDSPPIIIIQGDHGIGFGLDWANPTDEQIKNRLSIFNAYFFPPNNEILVYDTITPVNSFRLIFNSYFDSNFEILEDRMYFTNYENPYNFSNVTKIFIES